ncbi:MAG: L,D-transpeptidase [Sulfurospirillum sp.]
MKILYIPFLSLLFILQNSFAINMKKNYKIPQAQIDSFLKPIITKPYIIKIYSRYQHKATHLNSDTIFVKEGLKNLGKYRWMSRYKAYANTKNGRALFFKKDKKYLISYIKPESNYLFTKNLKSINATRLSKTKLKKIFRTFNRTKISASKEIFYTTLIKKLKKNRFLCLKNKEYILIIDKNLQKSYVFQFHKKSLSLEYIGGDRISTGNASLNTRNSRFVDTPIAIINRKKYRKGDWHANKTNFSEYGIKGGRVFYLGKYILPIEYNSKIKRKIHLAIHSTNPIDNLLLGHKASRGCIRISDNFNKILKKSALIDGVNGKYVIILDSKLSQKENIKRIKEFFAHKDQVGQNKKYAMK